jgi:hypothetical protein
MKSFREVVIHRKLKSEHEQVQSKITHFVTQMQSPDVAPRIAVNTRELPVLPVFGGVRAYWCPRVKIANLNLFV